MLMLPPERFLERIWQRQRHGIVVLQCRSILLHKSAVFRPTTQSGFFLFGVSPKAHHEIVEVDFVPVEIRTIDAGKLYFVADLDPAAATHPSAIDHDRVEADDRLDRMRARG